jgi:F-type H+-transporting ATPase subunit c
MRFSSMLLWAFLLMLASAGSAVAAESAGPGAAIGMGLSIVGIGIGIGLVGHSALSGIARQPEQAGAIQGAMFILAGLVEGAGIIALVLCLALVFI